MPRLVLTSSIGEQIVVGTGADIVLIEVVAMDTGKVRLCFDAAKHIQIDRVEVRLQREADRLRDEQEKPRGKS